MCPRGASAQTTPAPGQLTLVRQTAFVGPNGTFTAEVSTGDLPATTKLDLVIYNAITTRSRLNRTIAGEQLGNALYSTTATALSANQSTTTLSLPINEQWPAREGGTVLSESGIYPVRIEATAPNGSRLDSIVTHLLRLPSETTPTTPISLATTVVIDAPLEVSPDGSPRLSDTQLARAGEQFRILGGSLATPLTLAATPFVVQALTDAGDSSVRPENQVRQTLSRPFVSIDSGSLMAGGRGSVIETEYAAGDGVLSAAFAAAPDRRTQVLDPSVTPAAIDRLAALGTRSVVLQSSQLRSAVINDESSVLTNRFVIEGENGTSFSAMANDDTASSRLVLTKDPVLGAHHALAEIMMLHQEQPGTNRGAALTVPAGTDTAAFKEFLAGLSTTTGAASGSIGNAVIQPVTLDDLFARTAVATASQKPIVRDWTSNEPTELGAYGNQLEQAQWNLLGLQSMLPEGGELIAPIERTVLASAEATLDSSDRAAILANADSQLQALSSAISQTGVPRGHVLRNHSFSIEYDTNRYLRHHPSLRCLPPRCGGRLLGWRITCRIQPDRCALNRDFRVRAVCLGDCRTLLAGVVGPPFPPHSPSPRSGRRRRTITNPGWMTSVIASQIQREHHDRRTHRHR